MRFVKTGKESMFAAAMLLTAVLAGCSEKENSKPLPVPPEWKMEVTATLNAPLVMENPDADFLPSEQGSGMAHVRSMVQYFGPDDRIYIFNRSRNKMMDGCLKPVQAGSETARLTADGTLKGEVYGNDLLDLYYVPQNWNAELYIGQVVRQGRKPWWQRSILKSQDQGHGEAQTGRPEDAAHYGYAIGTMRVNNTSGGIIRPAQDRVDLNPQQCLFDFRMEFYDLYGSQVDLSEEEMNPNLHLEVAGSGYQLEFVPYSIAGRMFVAMNMFEESSARHELVLYISSKRGRLYMGTLISPVTPFANGLIFSVEQPLRMNAARDI